MNFIAPFGELDRLLFEILRTRWSRDRRERLRLPVSEAEFSYFVSAHGLAGILLRYHAQVIADDLGEPVLFQLRAAYMAAARGNQANISCISQLALLFEGAGIDWLLLKGIGLSVQLYADPNVRAAGDVDILVSAEDVQASVSAMGAAGFTILRDSVIDGSLSQWIRHRMTHQILLLSPLGTTVELHWRSDYSPGLSLKTQVKAPGAGAWQVQEIDVQGSSVRCLAGEYQLRHVARHAYRSMWLRWKWLYDVIELTQSSELGSAEVNASAASEYSLRVALEFAEQLMALPPGRLRGGNPGAGVDAASLLKLRDSKIEKEQRRAGRYLGEKKISYASSFGRAWFQARAHAGWAGKARYLIWRALVPSMEWIVRMRE